MNHTFQVDLRGMVDLLSQHLYTSPRVYLRELLQNATDAITARRATRPDAPAEIRIEPLELTGDGTLRVHDTGCGLTEEQVHQLLATIGASGKRDVLGFARREFLGQFGIGLLSCFVVADRIVLETSTGTAPPVRWTGYADGRYTVEPLPEVGRQPGTTVTLVPRPGAEEWLRSARVVELARLFGSLLPVRVRVGDVVTTVGEPPWVKLPDDAPGERRRRLLEYGRELLGMEPFDVVDLAVPEAGLVGVAYVLPTPVNPAARSGHRVYLKRMLLSESVEDLLPEWAFFVRCVVDTTELKPTASREALYADDLLESTREALGAQLQAWLVRLSRRDPARLRRFLDIHNLGVKALALHDDDMLRLVEQWWPMETNVGRLTLAEFRKRYGVLRYVSTMDEFRQVGSVAAAQDLPVINGGYTYDTEIIERLPTVDREVLIERLEPTDLTTQFASLDPATELALRPFLTTAQRVLDGLGCEVVVREFDPASTPALYLVSRSAAVADQLSRAREVADELWAGVLEALADSATTTDRPQLVVNYRNPLVRRVAAVTDPELTRLAVEAIYGQALMRGYHPMRSNDVALMNRSLLGLLRRAVPQEEQP